MHTRAESSSLIPRTQHLLLNCNSLSSYNTNDRSWTNGSNKQKNFVCDISIPLWRFPSGNTVQSGVTTYIIKEHISFSVSHFIHVHVQVVRFHPNGKYIATGSCDHTCRLWDIQSGRCVRLMTGSKVWCKGHFIYICTCVSDKQMQKTELFLQCT